MSKNSVSRGSTNEAVGSEIKFAGNDKEKMYEPKHRRKLVRVLTVIAYLFSVSLAAIMLSLFYVFIYNPGKPVGESSQNLEFPTGTRYHQVSQEFFDSFNDTYLNLESEEPRALPIKGPDDAVLIQPKKLFYNDENYLNHSLTSAKKNTSVYGNIIKLLKVK